MRNETESVGFPGSVGGALSNDASYTKYAFVLDVLYACDSKLTSTHRRAMTPHSMAVRNMELHVGAARTDHWGNMGNHTYAFMLMFQYKTENKIQN